MVILGLTGSIGMGKSTTAKIFVDAGIPVYDSDAVVHELYLPNGLAVDPIEAAFPNVKNELGGIDRAKLSQCVLNDSNSLQKLEAIVHPLVFEKRSSFVEVQKEKGAALIVFDIPLLFETGSEKYVDKILVVTAPKEIQQQRVLQRQGMTEEKFNAILEKQIPDSEKRKRADFIIDTSLGLEKARTDVLSVIDLLLKLKKKEEEF